MKNREMDEDRIYALALHALETIARGEPTALLIATNALGLILEEAKAVIETRKRQDDS